MISACLDTNILISGFVFGGKPLQCIQKAILKEYQLVLSSFILEETKRNLILKFYVPTDEAEKFLNAMMVLATIVEPKPFLKVIKTKINDNRILETALIGDADYLVTGDKKDILALASIGATKIVTPSQFLGLFL